MLVRALIVLLSVLNLGVAAWWIAHDPPQPAKPMSAAPGVARLQLESENTAPAAARPPAAAATAPEPSTPVVPTPALADITVPRTQQCFSFGPFASKDASTAAAAKLKPLVQKLTLREQAAATPARGWRVYLPPLPSLEQAQAVAQRIGAAGFSDFLIVREGDEARSIALGRYRNEEGAKKRADALIAAGFAVQVAPLGGPDDAAKTIWLDVIADEAFDPRRTQASIAAAQYRKADCAL
jgi:hypothetical protein